MAPRQDDISSAYYETIELKTEKLGCINEWRCELRPKAILVIKQYWNNQATLTEDEGKIVKETEGPVGITRLALSERVGKCVNSLELVSCLMIFEY